MQTLRRNAIPIVCFIFLFLVGMVIICSGAQRSSPLATLALPDNQSTTGRVFCEVVDVNVKEKTFRIEIPESYVFSPIRLRVTLRGPEDWKFYNKVVVRHPKSILMSGDGKTYLLKLTIEERPGSRKSIWVAIPEQTWKITIVQEAR